MLLEATHGRHGGGGAYIPTVLCVRVRTTVPVVGPVAVGKYCQCTGYTIFGVVLNKSPPSDFGQKRILNRQLYLTGLIYLVCIYVKNCLHDIVTFRRMRDEGQTT